MSCFLSPEPGLIYLYRIFSHFCLKQHIKSIIILDYLSVHQQIDQSRHCCSSARLLLCCNKRGSLHKLHSGGLLFDSTENLLLMCASVTSGHWHRRRRKTSALIQFWAAALKWSPERKKERKKNRSCTHLLCSPLSLFQITVLNAMDEEAAIGIKALGK